MTVTLVNVSLFVTSGLHAQTASWRSEMEKGDALRLTGNFANAAEPYRNAIRILEQLPPGSLDLAAAWNSLATVEVELNHPSEAKRDFEHALAETEQGPGRNSVAFAQVLLSFSGNYVRQGQYGKAEQQIREAIAIMTSLIPSNSLRLALARNCWGKHSFGNGVTTKLVWRLSKLLLSWNNNLLVTRENLACV